MSIVDVLYGWEAVEDALPDYQEAENYYKGEVAEWFSSEMIARRVKSTAIKHRFNMAKIPVDTLADRVELLAVTDPDSEQTTATIAEIFKANGMDIHYPDLITKAFFFGDAYVQVWPILPEDEPGDMDALDGPDDDLAEAGVEFVVHDPKNVRVIYDPANHRRKLFTIMRWPVMTMDGHDLWRVDLYYADRIERFQSKVDGDLTRADGWGEFNDPDDIGIGTVETGANGQTVASHIVENPFGENPFFHYRTALPYGVPVHKAAYGCQDAINKALITQLNVMDSAGWPERFGLTEPGAELDQAMDSPNDFDDEDVDSTDVLQGGQVTQHRSGPGVMHEFKGLKEVGTFDAADPSSFLEPATFYVRLMSQLTNTPLHRFDPTGDVPSGESLKTAEAPLVKTADRQKTMQTAPTVESWRFGLRVIGITARNLEVQWAPSQSATGLSDWQTIRAQQDAGVPIDQTLVEAGYDEDVVQGWLEEGAEELDLTRRVALLTSMADGIQKLAGAVATGVLQPEQADMIISEITGVAVKTSKPTPPPAPTGPPTQRPPSGGNGA